MKPTHHLRFIVGLALFVGIWVGTLWLYQAHPAIERSWKARPQQLSGNERRLLIYGNFLRDHPAWSFLVVSALPLGFLVMYVAELGARRADRATQQRRQSPPATGF